MKPQRDPPESPEDQEGRTAPNIVGIGPSSPKGGKPYTAAQRDLILARRDKAVELHARGYSYAAIGRLLEVSWQTAFNDIKLHLEHAARYWNASENREKIAGTLRLTVMRADEIHEKLTEANDPTSVELKLKALATMHRATLQLMRLYGFAGDQAMIGEGMDRTGDSIFSKEWAQKMDPERIKSMRDTIIQVYRAAQPEAVAAEFTVEEAAPEKPAS